MMSDERNETFEQAMNFYRSIGRDMGLDVEEEEWDTDADHDIPQVRMEDLTVAELLDCVEALMVLVDTRANKDMYKVTGDYKERKREAWGMAEDVLVRAGLMEVER